MRAPASRWSAQSGAFDSTQFAYQGLVGGAWNIDSQWRLFLEGRYVGTTAPTVNVAGFNVSVPNNNIVAIVGGQYKFPPAAAAPPPPPAPPVAPPSFMVFFDWDRSNLSQQALNTIKQAADAFKEQRQRPNHGDRPHRRRAPKNYNMALSLRRANAVKDALVREGVPAQAIAVIGGGEQGLLGRPATACVSRKTAASRSSSSKTGDIEQKGESSAAAHRRTHTPLDGK